MYTYMYMYHTRVYVHTCCAHLIFISPPCVHTQWPVHVCTCTSHTREHTHVHTCLMLVYNTCTSMYLYMHVPYTCTCTCTHIYVHAPPMHMYSTHTRVYIHVHAPQHVHACPIHVYMQLDYSLSVGKALPDTMYLDCMHLHHCLPPASLFDSCSAQGAITVMASISLLYVHACTVSFVARQYPCARNYGMTFDLWNILSHGT